jgi:hypothetical protein
MRRLAGGTPTTSPRSHSAWLSHCFSAIRRTDQASTGFSSLSRPAATAGFPSGRPPFDDRRQPRGSETASTPRAAGGKGNGSSKVGGRG